MPGRDGTGPFGQGPRGNGCPNLKNGGTGGNQAGAGRRQRGGQCGGNGRGQGFRRGLVNPTTQPTTNPVKDI